MKLRHLLPAFLILFAGAAFKGTAQTIPTLSVSISPVSVNEGNSGDTFATVTVSLSKAHTSDVDSRLLLSGSAALNSDYVFTALDSDTPITLREAAGGFSFFFNTGVTSIQFRIRVMGDILAESDETVVLTLGNELGRGGTGTKIPSTEVAVSTTNNRATFTIRNDDPTVVSLARTGSSMVDEGSTVEFTVTLGRTLIAGEIIDVPLIVSGTNITTTDWSLARKSGSSLNTGITLVNEATATPVVRFSDAGADTATLILTATPDNTPEGGAETLNLELGPNDASANGFDLASRDTNVGGGADPATDVANNMFNVTINDNAAPVISSNAMITVAEETTTVVTIAATDADSNPLTYNITAGADSARFRINQSNGALAFKTAPDFEAPRSADNSNIYEVEVTVADGTYNTKRTFTITVTNVNDNEPVINSSSTASVAEGTTTVLTVTATDADAGTTLTYSISGGADRTLFNINTNSGALTFITAPDFENPVDQGDDNSYEVEVTASDRTNSTAQTITVTVTDVNDNSPMITSAATASVAENSTNVLTVSATDEDAGTTFTYAISGGADGDVFNINTNSGALTFRIAPDFEGASVDGDDDYDVIVTVSDGTNSASQTITVTVTDVNEPPEITSSAVVNVPEGAITVLTVTATDADTGTTLTYAASGGADQALFSINQNNGGLTFKTAPDFETPEDQDRNNNYEVEVTASDGTNSTAQTITVTVSNVNDNAPMITSPATASVAENTTSVLTVTATDADSGTNLTYSISAGADSVRFSINQSSGALIFKTDPDFEMPEDQGMDNGYEVEVTASDGTNNAMQTITVTVKNDPSDDILGFSEAEEAIIFPNPSGDYLEVRSPMEGTFKIVSLSGKPLMEDTTNTRVDIASLQSGLYLVQLPDGRLLKFVRE